MKLLNLFRPRIKRRSREDILEEIKLWEIHLEYSADPVERYVIQGLIRELEAELG